MYVQCSNVARVSQNDSMIIYTNQSQYKVCNNNDEQRKRIRIDLSQTKTKVGKETVKGIKGGNILGGKCRKSSVTATLNSKQRYHNASLQLSGFLFKGGKLFNGEKASLVQCLASSNYQTRLQYDDDCGVKVSITLRSIEYAKLILVDITD